jgi:DnaD/phage-associated family protein
MTGDARQFKLLVCPALDVSSKDVDEAINQVAAVGLWIRYEVDGKGVVSIPEDSWFKHQSYINKAKRGDDSGSNYPKTPKNAEERRESPQNPVSFSLSSSVSSSVSVSSDTTAPAPNPFKLFESEGFGMLTEILGQKIGDMIDDFGEPWVREAMKEASYYGKRNLPYVKSILNRYRTSGIDEPWKQEKAGEQNGGTKESLRQGESAGDDKQTPGGKSGVLPSKYIHLLKDDSQVS